MTTHSEGVQEGSTPTTAEDSAAVAAGAQTVGLTLAQVGLATGFRAAVVVVMTLSPNFEDQQIKNCGRTSSLMEQNHIKAMSYLRGTKICQNLHSCIRVSANVLMTNAKRALTCSC
mmetsp:Transcript_33748/g.81783  ORF Transcript_33748/g.81783 Transcript_33748/m.81783 type:complete len:116 (+) Transcript_33748:341-688(+)